jgi:hypothetical protein
MARTEDSHLAKLEQSVPAQLPVTDPVDTALPEPFPAIPVRDESPALGSAHAISLSAANPVKLALPQDPRRRRAVLLAVDNDVYVASSLENAQAAEGVTTSSAAFYLPKNVPLVVTTKAALWISATTTASASRVSVLAEKDDE